MRREMVRNVSLPALQSVLMEAKVPDDHSFTVTILFGSCAVSSYERGMSLDKAKDEGSLETFSFRTQDELTAFMTGLDAGNGWLDYSIISGE